MSMVDNFRQLETKQKVMLVATVVVLLFVVYFGYDTFFGDSYTPAPASNEAAFDNESFAEEGDEATTAETPVATTAQAPTTAATATGAPMTSDSLMQADNEEFVPYQSNQQPNQGSNSIEKITNIEPSPEQLALIAESQRVQREYLKLVNQYQILQMQEKLAQTNASIEAAKLKTAMTAAEAQKLNVQMQQQTVTSLSTPDETDAKANTFASNLQVMYVGKQRGSWMAMLSSGGSYYEVRVGTRLPDGSTVSAIDTRGVVLTRNGARRFLTIPKSLD